MLQKAMAIKPEERYQSAEEFSQAFERAVNTREQAMRANPPISLSPPANVKAPVVPPGHAPTAAARSLPAPKPGPVITAPPQTLSSKHKLIDELDDDATEM